MQAAPASEGMQAEAGMHNRLASQAEETATQTPTQHLSDEREIHCSDDQRAEATPCSEPHRPGLLCVRRLTILAT